MVEFIKQNHLQCLLTFSNQEEADDFGNWVVQNSDNYLEVAIQSLSDLFDEEPLWVLVWVCSFLNHMILTASKSSLAERYLESLVKTIFISD